jgi:hypothetical protein
VCKRMSSDCEIVWSNIDLTQMICFSSADPLEEIDIGDEITPWPTFVNKNKAFIYRKVMFILILCLFQIETLLTI